MSQPGKPEANRWDDLSSQERRKVLLAALRRPMHLLILLIGIVMSLLTLTFWIPPLTIATYGALIFFSSRDPFFQRRVLEGRQKPGLPEPGKEPSPERRVRWLPRGQTREKVEGALEVQRRTLTAIEESDDVTRELLSDASPKLQELGNGLVDLADRREKASSEIQNLQKQAQKHNEGNRSQALQDGIQALQSEVGRADEELSRMVDQLLTLRSRVIRVSMESRTNAQETADSLSRDLTDLNRRVEALGETLDSTQNR